VAVGTLRRPDMSSTRAAQSLSLLSGLKKFVIFGTITLVNKERLSQYQQIADLLQERVNDHASCDGTLRLPASERASADLWSERACE
jgi:hypothetical protein